ncbi:hypothetical protein PMO31116_01537 [Pandoraea morbifera]|uniref:Uncharacterized protein n=1 Tax=Pandoraea morbifera TaxID=2508300 RepID=A0A5E4TPR9_9BURK|nr:hypothetical protein PMO31116_01537 [Pandoraea morbifera]
MNIGSPTAQPPLPTRVATNAPGACANTRTAETDQEVKDAIRQTLRGRIPVVIVGAHPIPYYQGDFHNAVKADLRTLMEADYGRSSPVDRMTVVANATRDGGGAISVARELNVKTLGVGFAGHDIDACDDALLIASGSPGNGHIMMPNSTVPVLLKLFSYLNDSEDNTRGGIMLAYGSRCDEALLLRVSGGWPYFNMSLGGLNENAVNAMNRAFVQRSCFASLTGYEHPNTGGVWRCVGDADERDPLPEQTTTLWETFWSQKWINIPGLDFHLDRGADV